MTAAPDTRFRCRCGALQGRAIGLTPKTGTRLVCHCKDCVRASRHFGLPVDAETGVDLVQTSADRIVIDSGMEHLALARLSPRGLFRWYARCCGTPMFNTLASPGMAFASVLTGRLEDTEGVGPVIAHAHRRVEDGNSRTDHVGRIVAGILGRAVRARISGRWRQTPFFDLATRKPVAEPEVLPRGAGLSD